MNKSTSAQVEHILFLMEESSTWVDDFSMIWWFIHSESLPFASDVPQFCWIQIHHLEIHPKLFCTIFGIFLLGRILSSPQKNITLPETNIAPENRPTPFLGAMLVLVREGRDDAVWLGLSQQATSHPPGHLRAHQPHGAVDATANLHVADDQGLGIGSTGAATSTELGYLE